MSEAGGKRVVIRCESCDAKIKVPTSAAGRRARCPTCGATFRVPSETTAASGDKAAGSGRHAEAPLKLRCPGCAARMRVPARAAGRKIKCPQCGRALRVPAGRIGGRSTTSRNGPHEPSDDLLGALSAAEKSAPAAASPTQTRQSGARAGDILRVAPVEPRFDQAPGTAGTPAVARGGRTCPSCRRTLPGDARICVACGVYLDTGRSILTTQDENLDNIYVYAERTIRAISWIIWLGVYPIASEAFGLRKPWVVRGVFALTVLVSFASFVCFWSDAPARRTFENMMLWTGDPQAAQELFSQIDFDEIDDPETLSNLREAQARLEGQEGFRPFQLVTHALLHADLVHLAGNMLFLLVLGARVNALIGNIWTIVLYPLLAIIAGLAEMISAAGGPPIPMLGASGAVMGLAGMYLVLFPIHRVHMAAWLRWGLIGAFRLSLKFFPVRGIWVVLFYIAFDVIYTVFGLEDNVAHWAHLGGFLGGAVIALILLFARRVDARGADILSTVFGRHAWKLIGRPGRAASGA